MFFFQHNVFAFCTNLSSAELLLDFLTNYRNADGFRKSTVVASSHVTATTASIAHISLLSSARRAVDNFHVSAVQSVTVMGRLAAASA